MLHENRITRNSTLSTKALLLWAFLLSFMICYLYARSVTLVYGVLELTIAAVCYMGCLKRYRKVDSNMLFYTVSAVILAWCAGVFGGDFKSTLLITVPLLMPLYISTLEITYKGWREFMPATIVAVAITYMAVEVEAFGEINSNTIGFMGFMGTSLGVLWIKNAKRKLLPTAIVLFGLYYSVQSGSRNVAIVGAICAGLLFLPKSAFKNRTAYFTICLGVVLYSVFSSDVMSWLFSNPKIYQFLVDYTSNYSEKAWEMVGRIEFLGRVQRRIAQRGILLQLFGTGTLTTHGHNMFYQCVLNFGYVGAVLIYAGFWRLFKMAYVLICRQDDDVVLGCVIILWGMFLLQGADVFVVGPETYAVIPQVIMGIILNRYGAYRNERGGEDRMKERRARYEENKEWGVTQP